MECLLAVSEVLENKIAKCVVFVFAGVLCASIGVSLAMATHPPIHFSVSDGHVSLRCENARVEDVIGRLSRGLNLDYKIYPNMSDELVTADFEKLPLQEATKKIVRENYALVYNKATNSIEKLYILKKGQVDGKAYQVIEKFFASEFPDQELLTGMVNQRVKMDHPTAELYTTIPHYDLMGNLVSYLYCYYTGEDVAPTKKVVNQKIATGWKEKKRAITEIANGYNERSSKNIARAVDRAEKASLMITRETDFISLEIGASYDVPPIIAHWDGLPIDISMFPKAQDAINNKLKDTNVRFRSTYITGLFSLVFAFETDGGKTYYVIPDSGQVFISWGKEPVGKREQAKEEEVKEKNRQKWMDFFDL